jgi:hypothetical protein
MTSATVALVIMIIKIDTATVAAYLSVCKMSGATVARHTCNVQMSTVTQIVWKRALLPPKNDHKLLKIRPQQDETASEALSADAKRPRKTPELPNKDSDVLSTAKAVSAKWIATPAISLIWMDAAAFAAIVAQYDAACNDRKMVRGERPVQTYTLKQLDKEIEKAAAAVKTYVTAKYERSNYTDIYPVLGFVKQGRAYRLPRDRQKRLSAMKIMITGIASEGFGNKKYGTAFWTTMRNNYETALNASITSAITVAATANKKNSLKKQILRVMKALQKVLEGNYPDTYRHAWRSWGWLKENY